MFLALDVDYREAAGPAVVAGVLFRAWEDSTPAEEHTHVLTHIAPYAPGLFYLRELPCLLALLAELPAPPTVVVVDGHVWLDAEDRAGLGAHLFAALDERIPVIGVAKTRFHSTPPAAELLRGTSQRPLYVTAAGLPSAAAKQCIARMHGEFRVPTLLKRVDRLCRDFVWEGGPGPGPVR